MIQQILQHSSQEAVQAAMQLSTPEALVFMEEMALLLADTFRRGNKKKITGYAGSAYGRQDKKLMIAFYPAAAGDPAHPVIIFLLEPFVIAR